MITKFGCFQVISRCANTGEEDVEFFVAKVVISTGELIPGTNIARCPCREFANLVAEALNHDMEQTVGEIPEVCSECEYNCSSDCDCWCHGNLAKHGFI